MTQMLRSAAALAGLALILALGVHTPASAQQPTPCGYWSEGVWVVTPCAQPQYPPPSQCGYYDEYGDWVPTPCGPPRHAQMAVSGRIVGVDGNMLAVATGPTRTVVVNDQPALNRLATGHIYTGRYITAYGYWDGGQFIATSIA